MTALMVLAAGAASAEPLSRDVSIGANTFTYASFIRIPRPFLTLDLAYEQQAGETGPWRWVRVGGGLRASLPTPYVTAPVEGFIEARLTGKLGIWEPAVGPELGLSGFAHLPPNFVLPATELLAREDARLGPLYVALTAAPLRFRFGNFRVSALELRIGVTGPPFGPVTRLDVGLFHLGVAL
jgi:hypothetical protein